MNRNLHSPTTLTEFARPFNEEPETLFTKFVNKLTNAYNTSYNTVNDLQTASTSNFTTSLSQNNLTVTDTNISRASSTSSLNSPKQTNLQAVGDKSSSTSTSSTNDDTSESVEKSDDLPMEGAEGRTMLNVLKRISNIVAAKNNNLRNYKDTELQRFWMPDSKAKECYDCGQKFSTFRRKHHCRLCGQIFCSKCCCQVVPGKIIMCSGDLKVCTYCSKIVLSYLKSPDITLDLKADLQALQDDLSSKLSQNQEQDRNNLEIRNSPLCRKISVGYQEERLVANQVTSLSIIDRKNILQQSNSLKALHEEMISLLPVQSCGTELISFLNTNQKSSNNIQAIAILNAMLEAGFLVPIVPDSDNLEFTENLHYRLVRKDDILISAQLQPETDCEGNSVHMTRSAQEEGSQYDGDLNLPKSLDGSISFQSVKEIELENSMRSTTNTTQHLLKAYCDHEELLLSQLLRSSNLDQSWSKILIPLCARTVNQFRPEFCSNELMDIRNYVNFKKVPGGLRSDCTIVGGVVFSKNVAHKEMATRIERPRILLLQCPIVYERVEGKFVSIETILLQEKEYLRNVTARILSLKPNVVLVHKNVAGIAQDMLRSHGITLVLDVKISVMERLERCLQCDIVTSIESNIGRPKLGTCDAFYIKNFDDGNGSSKTLMFFELLSSPRVSCCLLRGGSNYELARVKKVASLLAYARYNWRLEMAFLLDEFARPPSATPLIFDSKEHTPSENDDNMASNLSKSEEDIQDEIFNEDKVLPIIAKEEKNHNSPLPESAQVEQNQTKKLIERKSEDKLVTIENVNDFSDPLRAAEFSPTKYEPENQVEFEVQTPYDNRFRTALSSTVLSVSPFVNFPLPYLETEQGRKCTLRTHFPNELYFSKQWSNCSEKPLHFDSGTTVEENAVKLKPPHKFVRYKITKPADDREVQTLLAEYRAFGGRYPRSNKMTKIVKKQEPFQQPQKIMDDFIYKDALDLENHQRLPVLFCSFYYNPKATSSFCAQPTPLDMKFYGQHDIMLGKFLQRYCFRSSYICQSCNLPMMDHVRKYVHSMGLVQVFLTEDSNKNDTDKIYLTCWCSICNEMTPSVPISEDTFCLSFAKYLELRFHAHVYKKRVPDTPDNPSNGNNGISINNCSHSLHRDFVHYFSYKGIGAKFIYNPIDAWEISLPSLILYLKKPKPFDNMQVLEDIKNFSVKGHEVYSKIHEKIAELSTDEESSMLTSLKSYLNRDQLMFRQRVEIVQTLLTEKSVHSYDLNDAMLMAKRVLAESIELWGPRLEEATTQVKSNQKQESNSHIDSGTICTEDLKSDSESSVENKAIDSVEDTVKSETPGDLQLINDSEGSSPQVRSRDSITKSHHEHNSDKKSIKQLLSQLLPSSGHVDSLQSPFSINEHLTLPLGVFPILVHDQDVSSTIAYSLISNEYKKAIENLNLSSTCNSDTNSSPNVKRKSQDGSIDGDEKDSGKEEDKKTKSHSYIELYFQDLTTSFTCKIYFAKEFDAMRANVLKPPKLEKSIYKDLEFSKKREEIRLSQRNSCSSPSDLELHRKTSGNNLTPSKGSDTTKDGTPSQSDIDEARTFFARSLCRSFPWEARGGKSGSKFSKTLDDRFVLKEMSKTDIAIFENFASNYFEYINKCLQQNQPTLLAKILGVFRVIIKKKDSVQEKTLLVMENLFYDCDIKNKFDLKGSERNRLVDPTSQTGEIVLLDENLIQMSWFKPLYILSHSKTILREAINRDSSFLERNDIMDYSLLVGLNNKERVLVLGIIDYIRTYTLDKKLESIVKQSGLLGGQGKLPTVISPQRYKQRFIEAMDRYFYYVPDRWEGLSKK